VNDDDTDVEGSILEGGPFQDLYDRPDGVVAAQIVVEPELIEPVARCRSRSSTPAELVRATSAGRPSTNERRSSTRTIVGLRSVIAR